MDLYVEFESGKDLREKISMLADCNRSFANVLFTVNVRSNGQKSPSALIIVSFLGGFLKSWLLF